MKRLGIVAMILLLTCASRAGEFPASGEISDNAITEAEMKVLLEDWVDACKYLAGGPQGSTLTIASGEITPNRHAHRIDTEGAAASDYLDKIRADSVAVGHLLLLRTQNDSRDVTVRDHQAMPYIELEGNDPFTMKDTAHQILLYWTGIQWLELHRTYGAGATWAADLRTHIGALESASPDFTGDLTGPDIRLTSGSAATLSSTAHAFQVGNTAGTNLIMDSDEILARNNGATSTLKLQEEGGTVTIGNNTAWHAGNDGTGTGLDADLLDGIDGSGYLDPPYSIILGQKTSGNHGQPIPATTWTARDLTDATHVGSGITVNTTTDVITIPAGTWRCQITSTFATTYAGAVDYVTRLYRTAPVGSTLLTGTGIHTTYASGYVLQMTSTIAGRFALVSSSTIEIQGYHDGAGGSNIEGLAAGISSTYEVYTIAEFWKLD